MYETRTKIPAYVYQEFFCSSQESCGDRSASSFREDLEIPKSQRSKPRDYLGSGYDRGHMCPAMDCTSSQESMDASFLLSNIVPQNQKHNRGYWPKLEKLVRKLAKDHEMTQVFTGCLFLPTKCSDGKRRVIYEVIGEGNIAVPTHLFKVIFCYQNGKRTDFAYIIPNEAIDKEINLEFFKSTVHKIQDLSGLIFKPEQFLKN